MSEEFLPSVYQDSLKIWGCDPVLAMVWAFILLPIALAIIVVSLEALGRFLRVNPSPRSSIKLSKNRFEMRHQSQAAARLGLRRFTAPHLKANRVWQFRPRHRLARRPRARQLRPSGIPRSTTGDTMMMALKAYKRSPAIANSSWYNGILLSRLAGPGDNAGAFDLVVSKMRQGTEPPPHVHSREDALFYVLCGELRVYVGAEVFTLTSGECIFLPRGIPHALVVASEEARMIALITPGGFVDAFNKMNAPAQRMDLPTDPHTVTDEKPDLWETIKVFKEYGVRLLTPDEILTTMPRYPF